MQSANSLPALAYGPGGYYPKKGYAFGVPSPDCNPHGPAESEEDRFNALHLLCIHAARESQGANDMQKIVRWSTGPARRAAVAVALLAILVVGIVVVVPGLGGARVDPAVLYGRWVKSGHACDTKRGDIVIDADSFAGHMDSELALRMRIVSIAQKPPDSLELKLQSYTQAEFITFVTFTVKDATTLANEAGIWRKCP